MKKLCIYFLFILFIFNTFLTLENCKPNSNPGELPSPVCESVVGGKDTVETPVLIATLSDSWHESWVGSPAVMDIDEDGLTEIIIARSNLLITYHLDNTIVFKKETDGGRIWSSPVVADIVPALLGMEIAIASRSKLYLLDSSGNDVSGFPVEWRDELRSLSVGNIDNDPELEIVVVTTNKLSDNNQNDIIMAYNNDGSIVNGFPPNTSGASGCDDHCYVTGGFDQNIALGDVDGDGIEDIFVTQDNAYLSLHKGDGWAFDSNEIFQHPNKFQGIRFLHDYERAKLGWSDDEKNDNQAHFTNSAPAIADVDGDNNNELIVLASVQNASQSDRKRGVALWVVNNDGTRPDKWIEPFHIPEYKAGLWDLGDNIVAATNQVSVVDLYPNKEGLEFIFAGFDGNIHCVDYEQNHLWWYNYTSRKDVLTGGVVIADLSGDGIPEIIFNTYSTSENKGKLIILDGGGNELHNITLPGRGAMPVPTIADVNNDQSLEIIVSLKDSQNGTDQLLIYNIPNSADNCMLWITGRSNYLRNGFFGK